MTQTDFKNQVDNLMNILFGAGVASHATIIEQINYLVFLRSLSRKDDNAMILDPSAEKIFSGELRKYHWDNLLILNADELFNSLEEVFRKLPEITTNQTIKLLFRDAHVKVFDKPTLRRLVHEIEKMFSDLEKQATAGHTDIFGDMYEYLLSKLSQAGTLGSFRTPRHIIKFMVDVIDPKKGETILDPACGTAGFLVAALKHLEEKYSSDEYKKIDKYPMDLLTPQERDFVYKYTFTGFDSDFDMFKFGLMNLYLHKLEHPNMKRQNTLVDTAGDRTKWDVILANPPFAGALDIDSVSEDLRMGTRSTELLFLRYMIDHLSSSGRAGVIVPEGVVFNSTNAHKKIRQMLVEDAGLWCVVSLPGGIFNPYAGVKTSILFFDKFLKNKIKDILFIKVENDGFDLGATKRAIEKNDLPEALNWINGYKELLSKPLEPGLKPVMLDHGPKSKVNIIPISKIIESDDYSLNGDNYQDSTIYTQGEYPLCRLDEICDINPKKDELKNVPKDTTVSFVPMADLNENNISFKPRQTKNINEVIKGYIYFANNDVLIAKVTPCFENGKAGIAKDLQNSIGFGSSEFFVLRSKGEVLPELLFYFVSSPDFKNKGKKLMTGTGGLQRIPINFVKSYKIPVPPLSIQKQIVEELDGYQKIIDGAKQVVDNWKSNFKINPNWKVSKLSDVSEKITKGTTPTSNGFSFQESGINFIKIESITNNGDYIYSKFAHISDECNNSQKRSQLKNKDILFSIAGALGRVALVSEQELPANINQALAVITLKENVLPEYVIQVLRSDLIQKQLNGLKVGVAQSNLSLTQVSNFEIPLPSIDIQKGIVEKLKIEKDVINQISKLIKSYQERINQRIEEVWSD